MDGVRYDIISMLGKRATVVTSRFVDAISAGVYDRASDVFLPRENYQAIANRGRLILNSVGETDIVARNDFHG